MSFTKIERDSKEIAYPRKTIVISQNLATSTSFTINLRTNPYNLEFIPRYMIVRQIAYAPSTSDSGNSLYMIQTNLSNIEYIGCVYYGIQANSHFPMSVNLLPLNTQSISFTITNAVTANNAPSGYINLVLEFCTNM